MPRAIAPQRRPIGAGQQRVAVVLAGRGEPRMKRIVDLGRFTHRDLPRQLAVEAAAYAVERNRPLGPKQRDLPARVHTGIGARCADDLDLVREQLRETFFEVLLHRRAVELALPAVKAGAVVLDDEADVAHAWGVSEVRFDADRAGVLTVANAIVEQERTVVAEVQPQRLDRQSVAE